MIQKEIEFRKKREMGDIFTDSFEFIKQEIKPISKLVAIYVLPFFILYGFVQIYLQKNVISKIDFTNTEALLENIGPVYLNVFMFVLFGLFVQSLLIASYYTYIEVYIKKGKGNFDLSDVTPHLFANGLMAIGASIIVFIIVMFGLILCIIPGIFFANTLSIVLIILLFERKGIGSALLRSSSLVNRQWWNTFLINIVGLIFVWVVNFIMAIPTLISGLSISIFNQKQSPVEYPDWYWVILGVSTVVSSLFYIIPYTFLAFQYFNLAEQFKNIQPTEIP